MRRCFFFFSKNFINKGIAICPVILAYIDARYLVKLSRVISEHVYGRVFFFSSCLYVVVPVFFVEHYT